MSMVGKRLAAFALALVMGLFALVVAPGAAFAEEASEAADDEAAVVSEEEATEETEVVTLTFNVTYFQTEARSMLEMINEFRTGDDAWAWDEDDATKIYYTDLEELTYSYELEAIAMQRAAEIALYYSHTRPDGSDNDTVFEDVEEYSYVYTWEEEGEDGIYIYSIIYGPGENIAYGASTANDGVVEETTETNEAGEEVVVSDEWFASAEEAFEAWLEEDYGYDGQGHRRNMLGDYNAIGIACVYCNGGYFWVQVLGYVDDEADDAATEDTESGDVEGEDAEDEDTTPNDSVTTVTVDVSADYVTVSSVVPDSESYTLTVGETAETPIVLVFLENEASATTEGLVVATATPSWTSSDTNVVSIAEDGSIVGVGEGEATLTATMLGNEVSITVYVVAAGSHTHDYSTDQTWRWYADGTVTVTFTCASDVCGVTTTVEAEVEAEVTEATCDEDAYTTYTATVTLDDGTTATDERIITDAGTATGHVYGEPEWTWAADYSSATATFTCSACDETMTVDAEVTSESTSSSCDEEGTTTYTATVTLDETTYTATQSETVAATGHSYDEGVVTTEATCTEDGVITYTCSVCGDSYTEAIVATGHSYDEGVVTEATCTEDGYTTYTCTVCGDSYTEAGESATGHSYEAVVTDPTCTEQGYTTYTCTVCGNSYVDDYTDALGHSYEAVVTDPTCTEDGYITYTCSVCGDSYTEEGEPALGHSYDEGTVTTEATCTEDGVITYTCSVCGDSYTEAIAATGHSYEGVVTDPTCTEQGYTTYTCTVCGDSYTDDYVDALGHSYDEGVVTDSTCTDAGYTTYTCTVCGESYTEEGEPALGHSYESEVTVEATCTEDGVITYTCTRCGDSYTEAIEATGHSYEGVVTDPTCTDAGYTTYTCTVCGESYTDDYVDATGHSYDEGVVTVEATCTEDGVVTYTCTVCGDSYEEAIAATGHDYESVVTDPTCTERGYTTYTCTVCGDSYTDDYVEAAGHSYENPAWAWTEDYSSATLTLTCSACGDELVLEAEVTADVVEATCEENGTATYSATVTYDETTYSDVQTGEETAALGHAYGEPSWTWTQTDEGYAAVATFTCENDETHTVEAEASIEVTATVEATYDAEGSITYMAAATLNDTVYTDEYVVTIAQLETITYEVIDGIDEEVSADASSDLTVTASGDAENFVGLYMDGDLVDPENYTVESGSTVVTLKASYLATLEAGEHQLTFMYTDGTASTSLTILETHEHTYTAVEAVAATCTEDGTIAYYVCDGCGAYFTAATDDEGTVTYTEVTADDLVVAATGHTYSLSAKFASDFSSATVTATCSVCGETQSAETTELTVTEMEDGSTVYVGYVTIDGVTYKATATVPAGDDTGEADIEETAEQVSESTDLVSDAADDDEADEDTDADADEDAEEAEETGDAAFSDTGDSTGTVVVVVVAVAAVALIALIATFVVRRRRSA